MKRAVYQDGNGSGLIMVDGLGEYIPLAEHLELDRKTVKTRELLSRALAMAEYDPSNKAGIKEIKEELFELFQG